MIRFFILFSLLWSHFSFSSAGAAQAKARTSEQSHAPRPLLCPQNRLWTNRVAQPVEAQSKGDHDKSKTEIVNAVVPNKPKVLGKPVSLQPGILNRLQEKTFIVMPSLPEHERLDLSYWTPDSKLFLRGSRYNRIWNVQTNEILPVRYNNQLDALSPDYKLVLHVEPYLAPFEQRVPGFQKQKFKTLDVWDIQSNKLKFKLGYGFNRISDAACSPDAKMWVEVMDTPVKRDVQEDKPKLKSENENSNLFSSYRWSPDSQMILVVADNNADILHAQTGKKLRTFNHESPLSDQVWWCPNSQRVTTRVANTLYIWDVQTGRLLKSFDLSKPAESVEISWSPDSETMAARTKDAVDVYRHGTIYNLNPKVYLSNDLKLAFMPRSGAQEWQHPYIQFVGSGTIPVFKGSDDTPKAAWMTVESVHWSPDSNFLIVCAKGDRECYIYDLQARKEAILFDSNVKVKEVYWSPDSKFVLISTDNNTVQLWQIDRGMIGKLGAMRLIKSFDMSSIFNFSNPWSVDSNFFLFHKRYEGISGTAVISDVQQGGMDYALPKKYDGGFDAHLSPDGKFIKLREGIWNIEHATNKAAHEELEALKKGLLDPAQYELLRLLEEYLEKEHAEQARLDWRERIEREKKAQALDGAVALGQSQGFTYSMEDALRALLMFNPIIRKMILRAYGINDDRVAFELAKEKLFEEQRTVSTELQQDQLTGKNVTLLAGAPVLEHLKEYVLGVEQKSVAPETTAQKTEREAKEKMHLENWRSRTDIERAQQWEKNKDAATTALFAGIKLFNLQQVRENLNPVTVQSRNPDAKNANFRTPLMEVIRNGEKKYSDCDGIFYILLNYGGEYVRDEHHKEYRTSDFAAQDSNGDTPLLLALKMHRFDYALRIAQKMNDKKWYKAFQIRDGIGKSAFDVAAEKKEKYGNDYFLIQLLEILDLIKDGKWLLAAIKENDFDNALKIAQEMNSNAALHGAFKQTDRNGKTVYDLIIEAKPRYHRNDVLFRLSNILDIHHNGFLKGKWLLVAIELRDFDTALKIAQEMNANAALHAGFKQTDYSGKTAYDLMIEGKERFKNNDTFIRLLNILDIQHKGIGRKKAFFY